MKIFSILLFFSILAGKDSVSQILPTLCDTTGLFAIRNNSVFEQWEFKIDKKTKKKIFNSYKEYNENGCVSKIILPSEKQEGEYDFKEWQYATNGRLMMYREGKIDSDSAKIIFFSKSFSYTFDGKLSRYKKEIHEGEMSQTIEKLDYSYSIKGEISEIIYSVLKVKKDTILNDEVKYSGNGIPYERTIHNYYPKGISEFTRYNSHGMPTEQMRYERGKAVQHKIFSYTYDKSGQLVEESISDGIGKTVEKKKYEKDKIIYTKLNTKGKVINTSSLPYSSPQKISFPSQPEITFVPNPKPELKKYSSSKQKLDKKKNKIVENYSGNKLVSTEIYDAKGLLTDIMPAEGSFNIKYEYTFY